MRIRMKGVIAGPRNGVDWPPVGGELDVPDEEGASLCASGLAEPVAVVKEERAVAPEPEKRRGPGRPRKPVDD